MSVGANPAGITPKVAQQIAQVQANRNQGNQANGPNAAAKGPTLTNVNSPASAPPPAVFTPAVTPGAPAAPAVGGTTSPGAKGSIAAPAAPAAQAQAGNMAAAMSVFAPFLAMAGAAAITTNKTKVSSISGDSSKESGNVEVETKAEAEGHLATKDTKSATGNEAGDISGANSTSGPST